MDVYDSVLPGIGSKISLALPGDNERGNGHVDVGPQSAAFSPVHSKQEKTNEKPNEHLDTCDHTASSCACCFAKRINTNNNNNNRELTERFQNLKALYNVKKNIQCTNTHNCTNQ